jgi:hypothetical protein
VTIDAVMASVRRALSLPLVLAGVTAALGMAAFTATNTVQPNRAGSGQGAVTGFTVSRIRYTLSPVPPSAITTVRFRVAPARARTARVQLQPGSQWYACGLVARRDATCAISPPAPLVAAAGLRIVAAQ